MEQNLRVPAMNLSRRFVLAGAFALGLLPAAHHAANAQFGPPELIEAARKEGKLVFYSANVAESETPVINAFNKRFPFIKVEFLRAPGNQLPAAS
jgi:iron(III) transport system substrate-binding protein